MRNIKSRKKDGGTTTDRYLSAETHGCLLVYVLLHVVFIGIRKVKAIALSPRSRDYSVSRYLSFFPEDSRNPFYVMRISKEVHMKP